MATAITNSVQPSAVSIAVPRDLRTVSPIRVVTNAGSEACERLRDLGFAVRVLGAAALKALSAADIDADIVIVDGSLTGTWSPLDGHKINAPVVFIVVDESIDADSSFAAPSDADRRVALETEVIC
jgi:hypothetical protein